MLEISGKWCGLCSSVEKTKRLLLVNNGMYRICEKCYKEHLTKMKVTVKESGFWCEIDFGGEFVKQYRFHFSLLKTKKFSAIYWSNSFYPVIYEEDPWEFER